MADVDEFHVARREWSARKHGILVKYLSGADRVWSRFPEVTFVDGLAGQGRFDDQTPQSSVLIAELARARSADDRHLVKCINVESDPDLFQRLTLETSAVAPALVHNLLGSWQERSGEVMRRLGRSPAVIFLDPFGVVQIPWSSIEPFLKRPLTDVLMIFMGTAAARTSGAATGQLHTSRDAQASTMDAVFGTSEWREVVAQSQPGDRLRDGLCSLYLRRLGSASRYAYSFDVKTADGVYKYSMMLATHGDVALKITNDVFYKTDGEQELAAEERRQAQALQTRQQLSFALELNPVAASIFAVQRQRTAILTLFENSEGLVLERRQLRRALWARGWFGKATTTQQNVAVSELDREGRIHVERGSRAAETDRISLRASR